MIERVTAESLDRHLELYAKVRGGIDNEQTESEAQFIFVRKYGGLYFLHAGAPGPLWIGAQNATARWSADGQGSRFPSVRAAIDGVIGCRDAMSIGQALFYTDDSVERLRWMAERIEAFKASGDFLLYA